MFLAVGCLRPPPRAKEVGETAGVVAGDVEPRALTGTVRGESGEYRDRAWPGSGPEGLDVAIGQALGSEEVQHGTVVPDLIGPPRPPSQHVLHQPVHALGRRPEPSAGNVEADAGDVENSDVVEAAVQQSIHQGRAAAAHVDDAMAGRDAGAGKHPERHGRLRLVPAARGVANPVGTVPVPGWPAVLIHRSIVEPRRLRWRRRR